THLLGLFLGQAARSRDGDFLLLVGGFVLRAHVQDAVRIDVKSDLDLRRPARSRRNPVQFEFAKRTVVAGEFALALQNVDFHARLVVRRRRIRLDLARRDRGVARTLNGQHAAARLYAQRERLHIQQQDVLYVARENRALNRRAYGDDFVWVYALVGFFPAEEVAHQRLYLGDARRAAHLNHFLDVIGRHLRVFQRLLHRLHRSFQQIVHHLLEPRAGELLLHVNRPAGARGDERQVDLRLHHLRELDLG